MPASLVQDVRVVIPSTSAGDIVQSSAPTAGNLLVLIASARGGAPLVPAGFTSYLTVGPIGTNTGYGLLAYRVVQGGDDATWPTLVDDARSYILMEWSGITAPATGLATIAGAGTYSTAADAIVADPGGNLAIGAFLHGTDIAGRETHVTGGTLVDEGATELSGDGPYLSVGYSNTGEVSGTAGNAAFHDVGIIAAGFIVDDEPSPETPPHEPAEPGQAIVEIYVDDPDGYRWDVAQWDEATWGEAGWVSITEWVIFADVTWGADRADAGILADQKAGSWVVQTHDPDRVLDPANDESQFYPHLVPDLPIRINHGSMRTVRTGQVTDVMYSHAERGGRIAASDAVSRASRAKVPPGTALGDTFLERVQDSVAAGDIDLWVQFPAGPLMDESLAPDDPDARKSVWQRISEAARELLVVPWVDRDGSIRVTAWDADTDRGLVVDSSVMVDLQPWVSFDGLYSVVRALDEDGVTIAESKAAPMPAYGEVVYERTDPTIDSESWTARVLADRVGAVLRYRPGTIVPHLAEDNNLLIDMELMDIITLSFPEADPPVSVRARVLGARVRVTDRTKQLPAVLTRWEWTLLTTIVPTNPLISDNDASIRYLISDNDGVSLLYPG
jgi:hypothetical protein